MENIDTEVVLSLFRSTTNIEAFKEFLRNLPMNKAVEKMLVPLLHHPHPHKIVIQNLNHKLHS